MRNEEKKDGKRTTLDFTYTYSNFIYIYISIYMYNKLYTYVHEIFLSTTIVTSNLTILLDFFTIMWKGKGKE